MLGSDAPRPSPSTKAAPIMAPWVVTSGMTAEGRRGEQEREHDHVPLEHDLEEERRHEAHDERGRREAPEHPADFGGRKPHARGVDRDEQVADLPGDRDDDRGDEHGAHRAVAQEVRGCPLRASRLRPDGAGPCLHDDPEGGHEEEHGENEGRNRAPDVDGRVESRSIT